MKIYLLICALIFSTLTLAETTSTLVRIQNDNGLFHVIRSEDGLRIPVIPANAEIKALMESLSGSEALMKGHITYVKDLEHQPLRPVFVVEEMKAISLRDLKVNYTAEAIPAPKEVHQEIVLRPAFPVTAEVASAITMTTSILMMEELTSGSGDPGGRRELRQALFFSAGAMATLLFIYEQIQGKTKP